MLALLWRHGHSLALAWWFRILEATIPTSRSSWLFCAWPGPYPHTVDNVRAVFEAVKNDPSVHKIVLVRTKRQDRDGAEGVNVRFVNAESFLGAFFVARAHVLLLGYASQALSSYGSHVTRKHRIVQLWHGIPLKRIGRLFPPEQFWEGETDKYAAAVCSAPRDREFMCAAFAPLQREAVWQTGLPRNDIFLMTEDALPRDYVGHLTQLRAILAGRRLILYAPTWRANAPGVYNFSARGSAALRSLLERHNAVLGIRAHAIQREDPSNAVPAFPFCFLNDFPDVNILLRETAVLLTDYSSIYIDFLLTGRPIVHFTYDVTTYVSERGFLYDLDEALPSSPIDTEADLMVALNGALGGKIDETRYGNALALFHDHPEEVGTSVLERIRELAAK